MMAAEMVRSGSVVADVGTDHAFLPSFLILNGISPFCYCCDVRSGPLDNARATVRQYGIEDKVSLILSDGLDSLPENAADDIVMCGMGGTLMAELLSRAQWIRNPSVSLVLQPQSHSEDVRQFLLSNGFVIHEERACEDSGRFYSAMRASCAGESREYDSSFYYVGLLPLNSDDASSECVRTVKKRLTEKYKGAIASGNEADAEKYRTILEKIGD